MADDLVNAIKEENLQVIDRLLQGGINLNFIDDIGKTPLYYAIKKKNVNIVELFLQNGANVNGIIKHRHRLTMRVDHSLFSSPLHTAIRWKLVNMVEILLQHNADPNFVDYTSLSPLCRAVELPNLAMINLLIQHGADVNFVDPQGMTPLYFGVNRWKSGFYFGKIIPTRKRVKYYRNLLLRNEYPVISETMQEELQPYFNLLDECKQVVLTLLDNGAQVNVYDIDRRTPLIYSIIRFSYDDVMFLLHSKGRYQYKEKVVCLYHAVFKYQNDIVRILIEHGADLEFRGENGWTPLQYAVMNGKLTVIELLLQNGAHINTMDSLSKTCLHNVISSVDSFLESFYVNLCILLEKNFGTTCVDDQAYDENPEEVTTMKSVVELIFFKLIAILDFYGIDVDARGFQDRTGLMYAVSKICFPAVVQLLQLGADGELMDNQDRTALYVALTLTGTQNAVRMVAIILGSGVSIRSSLEHELFGFMLSAHGHRMIELFPYFIIRLQTLHLYIEERDLVPLTESHVRYQEMCNDEIEYMKSVEVVENYNLTLYDILTKDWRPLAINLRSKTVQENIMTAIMVDYDNQLPIYSDFIMCSAMKGLRLRRLLNEANLIVFNIFQSIYPNRISDIIVERIIDYLHYDHIKYLVYSRSM